MKKMFLFSFCALSALCQPLQAGGEPGEREGALVTRPNTPPPPAVPEERDLPEGSGGGAALREAEAGSTSSQNVQQIIAAAIANGTYIIDYLKVFDFTTPQGQDEAAKAYHQLDVALLQKEDSLIQTKQSLREARKRHPEGSAEYRHLTEEYNQAVEQSEELDKITLRASDAWHEAFMSST